jgi:type IV secretory pathway VirD2 relaxase
VLQQSVVKARYVQNRGGSGWRAHGRYLAREGAQQEAKQGLGFDAHEQEIDIAGRLGAWQRAGDPRLWKLIVSPEAGERLDLRQHARDLVAAMEGDLGLRLEWVAIEHFDTAHPHVHVVVRGRSKDGRLFRMPRDYVGHGIRQRSQEIATRTLGLRLDRDRIAGRERAVEVRHFGVLDQMLERRADAQRRIQFEAAVPSEEASRTLRLQLLRRLGFLSGLGLARRVGKHSYELSEHHRAALQQMQLARDLQRSLTLFGEPLVDPSAPQRFTELVPGVGLRGSVVGGAEDEAGGRLFLIVARS